METVEAVGRTILWGALAGATAYVTMLVLRLAYVNSNEWAREKGYGDQRTPEQRRAERNAQPWAGRLAALIAAGLRDRAKGGSTMDRQFLDKSCTAAEEVLTRNMRAANEALLADPNRFKWLARWGSLREKAAAFLTVGVFVVLGWDVQTVNWWHVLYVLSAVYVGYRYLRLRGSIRRMLGQGYGVLGDHQDAWVAWIDDAFDFEGHMESWASRLAPSLKGSGLTPDRQIARQLRAGIIERSAADAKAAGDYHRFQRYEATLNWIAAGAPWEENEPPERWDRQDPIHVRAAGTVVNAYGAVLEDKAGPWADCMFRPEAELPFPKAHILESIETLLDMAETKRDGLEVSVDVAEALEAIQVGIDALQTFIDAPPAEVPTDPRENAVWGVRYVS